MSDNFDVLFATKINQNILKKQLLHVEKNKIHGRTIELVDDQKKGWGDKFLNRVRKIFGIEQRRVAKLCVESKDLKNRIELEKTEGLQTLKTNLSEIKNWVDDYNAKLGPLKVFLKIKYPFQNVQEIIDDKLKEKSSDRDIQKDKEGLKKLDESGLTKDHIRSNAVLHAFLRGEGTNLRRGIPQTIAQIQAYDFETKEAEHDFIQWIFPSAKPSGSNSLSPMLTFSLVEELKKDPVVVDNIKKSFLSMLEFYGLKYDEQTHEVTKGKNFENRSKVWLTPHNHNFLRITRIMESLDHFGLKNEQKAFQKCMLDLASENNQIIDSNTAWHWRNPHQ